MAAGAKTPDGDDTLMPRASRICERLTRMNTNNGFIALRCPLTESVVKQRFSGPPDKPFLAVESVVDSGRTRTEPARHTLTVGLVVKGQCQIVAEGVEYLAERGDLILIESGVEHTNRPAGQEMRSYHLLGLEPVWCLEQVDPVFPGQMVPRVRNRVVRSPKLFSAMLRGLEAVCCEHRYHRQEFSQAIGTLLRKNCAFEPAPKDNAELHSQISRARDIIMESMEAPPKVTEIAEMVGLGREAFTRSFQKIVGISPGSYQHCVRLLRARRLLNQGHSITEAALATGYTDQSHFHRMFVKHFDTTPRQYRLMNAGAPLCPAQIMDEGRA